MSVTCEMQARVRTVSSVRICANRSCFTPLLFLQVRDITDALDAAGNTTAAIGKGFAIGSAALVSLALFGAFVTTVGLQTVDILQPYQFAGLLVGAMLPYWFSAMVSTHFNALFIFSLVRCPIRDTKSYLSIHVLTLLHSCGFCV